MAQRSAPAMDPPPQYDGMWTPQHDGARTPQQQLHTDRAGSSGRFDPVAASCGSCYAGADGASCAAFLRDRRNQSALFLAAGMYTLLVSVPLYVASFSLFAALLTLGCVFFACGLVYDVLLIGITKDQARDPRACHPRVAADRIVP